MSQKFKSELELQALNNATTDTDKFLVSDGGIVKYRTGTEVLSDLGVTLNTASKLQHQVKAGVAINKGQAVYVTSADGTNMIVGLASNASEATSSKTMGLLDATVAINDFANVVTEGLLAGLNTSTANAGDPVWLGTGGNLIYGLINKPYAPAHLVFIGIVTRVNTNNGEIFVKVQNGFELNEIHDIDLKTTTPINGHILGFDGTLWVNKTIAGWLGYTPANASGTTNYLSKFTGTTTLGNSLLFDNGTNVGIGTTSPGTINSVSFAGVGLHVKSGNQGRAILEGVDQGELLINDIGASANQRIKAITSDGGKLFLGAYDDNGTARRQLTIDNSGNVGIGTTAPNARLDVQQSVDGNAPVIFANSSTGTSARNSISLGNNTGTISSIDLYGSNYNIGSTDDVANGLRILNSGAGGVAIRASNAGGSIRSYIGSSEVMRVASNSNVGIGTTSPSGKLHVVGTSPSIFVDTSNTFAVTIGAASATPNIVAIGTSGSGVPQIQGYTTGFGATANLSLQPNGANVGIGTTSADSRLHISAPASNLLRMVRTGGTATNFGFELGSGAIGLYNYSTSTYGWYLGSTGNIGIGTTSPGAKLDVEAATTGYAVIIKNTTAGGDYLKMTGDSGNTAFEFGSGGTGADAFLNMYADNTQKVLVNADGISYFNGGNVGIGTSSPNSKLEVFDGDVSVTTSGSFSFFNSNRNFIPNTGGVSLGALRFRGYSTGTTYQVGSAIYSFSQGAWSSTSAPGYLSLQTTSAGSTSPSERMVINSAGGIKFNNYGSGTFTGTATQKLAVDSSGNIIEIPIGAGPVDGSGTTNYVTKWTDSDTIGNSIMYDNGTNVGIGTASPTAKLSIGGVGSALSFDTLGASGTTEIKTIQDYELSIKNNRGTSTEILVGNEILKFSTSELERMRITSAGNVGIGTTAPSTKLDVVGTANTFASIGTTGASSGRALLFQDKKVTATKYNWLIGAQYNIDNAFEITPSTAIGGSTYSTPSVTILQSGNVGIGTTSPTNRLHVLGGILNGAVATFSGQNNDRGLVISTFNSGNSDAGVLLNAQTSLGVLSFATVGSERMRIDSDGNILVGQTSAIYSATNRANLTIGKSAGSIIVLGTSTASNGYLFYNNTDVELANSTSSGSVFFRTAGTERMRITSTGNVGIGTSTPNEKLTVSGKIYANPNQPVVLSGLGAPYYGTNITLASDIGSTQGANRIWSRYDGTGSGAITFERSTNSQAYNSDPQLLTYTESMRIAGNGNVGIGTSSPSNLLHLSSSSSTNFIVERTGSNGVFMGLKDSSGSLSYLGSNNGDFLIQTPGNGYSTKLTVLNSGNVGIGTSSPGRPLTVASSNIGIRMDNSSNSNAGLEYYVSTGIFHNWLLGAQYNVANTFEITPSTTVGGTTYSTPAFVVNANGNVGIGTSSPDPFKLAVNGTIGINGTLGSTLGSLYIDHSGVQSWKIGVTATNTSTLSIGNDVDGAFANKILNLTNAGNVGIGTSSPSDKLHVASGNVAIDINQRLVLRASDPDASYLTYTNIGYQRTKLYGYYGLELSSLNGGIFITTAGNVGIGTTSPSYQLSLSKAGSTFFQVENTSTLNSVFYGNSGGNGWIETTGAYATVFQNNGSERMRITSTGNVGIGTTNPSYQLDVANSGRFGGLLISNDRLWLNGNTVISDWISSGLSSGYSQANSYGWINGAGNLVLGTNGSERMRITSGGNVGIGTTSPSYKLHVAGTIGLTDDLTFASTNPQIKWNAGLFRFTSLGIGNVVFTIAESGEATFSSSVTASQFNISNSNQTISIANTSDIQINAAAASSSILFRASGDERMRITSGGNVGIGTTSPGAKLDVNGDALINGLTVGRGPGNSSNNTAFGLGALGGNTSGEYNLAIGRSANTFVNISGSTVIGTDLFTNPGNNSLTSNCLAISQYNPDNSGTQYPHIYAPDKINCPNGNTTTDVLAVDYSIYTAVFMEYSIFNSAGDQFRAGTFTVAFKGTGTPVEDDNQTVVYSGTTLSATFTTSIAGSVATIQLRNQDSDTYDIRVTARLLMR